MDMTIEQFEQTMRKELQRFSESRDGSKPRRKAAEVSRPTQGLTVVLGVKSKRLEWETPFAVQTSSISRLEARIEAERKAREAGWPIVSHVIDYQMEA